MAYGVCHAEQCWMTVYPVCVYVHACRWDIPCTAASTNGPPAPLMMVKATREPWSAGELRHGTRHDTRHDTLKQCKAPAHLQRKHVDKECSSGTRGARHSAHVCVAHRRGWTCSALTVCCCVFSFPNPHDNRANHTQSVGQVGVQAKCNTRNPSMTHTGRYQILPLATTGTQHTHQAFKWCARALHAQATCRRGACRPGCDGMNVWVCVGMNHSSRFSSKRYDVSTKSPDNAVRDSSGWIKAVPQCRSTTMPRCHSTTPLRKRTTLYRML